MFFSDPVKAIVEKHNKIGDKVSNIMKSRFGSYKFSWW